MTTESSEIINSIVEKHTVFANVGLETLAAYAQKLIEDHAKVKVICDDGLRSLYEIDVGLKEIMQETLKAANPHQAKKRLQTIKDIFESALADAGGRHGTVAKIVGDHITVQSENLKCNLKLLSVQLKSVAAESHKKSGESKTNETNVGVFLDKAEKHLESLKSNDIQFRIDAIQKEIEKMSDIESFKRLKSNGVQLNSDQSFLLDLHLPHLNNLKEQKKAAEEALEVRAAEIAKAKSKVDKFKGSKGARRESASGHTTTAQKCQALAEQFDLALKKSVEMEEMVGSLQTCLRRIKAAIECLDIQGKPWFRGWSTASEEN